MNESKSTNTLLLFLVVPLVFFLLKELSFIFVPLIGAMFIALIFLPLVRWLKSKGSPKAINMIIVIILIAAGIKLFGELIQLSSREILAQDNGYFEEAGVKIKTLINNLEAFFGFSFLQGENLVSSVVNKENISKNLVPTVGFVTNALTMTLTMAFFVILLLAESFDIRKVLQSALFKRTFTSTRILRKVEKDLANFILVKILISAGTGIGIGLACYLFGVSFPIFWGIFAFAINFLQMIGSVICVIVVSLFAFVDLEMSQLLIFALICTGIQGLFGGVLEPVFMGKTFSINVVSILIMLMLWGYIWGIPGLIMSIPITVFLKIVFEQFEKTKIIAEILSVNSADPKKA